MRCVHEASLHQDNCFITLTYNDEHLPNDQSVDVRHFQLFMKKLRKKYGPGIRFFHCGEYGDKYGRPHYHACLFNHDFQDKTLWKTRNGEKLYISPSLSELWGQGFSTTGTLTFSSAAYVARYVTKKINAAGPYTRIIINPKTGEVHDVAPEYGTMSRGGRTSLGGIGRDWIEQYQSETYPSDFIILKGVKMRPPRAYDKLLDEAYLKSLKFRRKAKAAEHSEDNTPERRKVRERVQEARFAQLPRNLYGD